MIVLYSIFTALLLYGIEIIPKDDFNDEYMTQDSCSSYKGLCSILVIITHTQYWVKNDIIIKNIGLYPVAIFFFISGYGLMKRYLEDQFYYKKFLMRRVVSGIVIPYMIMNAIYWFYYVACGEVWSLKDIFLAITSDRLLVSFSWYIIAIFAFYCWFWGLMILNKKSFMLLGTCIFYLIWEYVCLKNNLLGQWYITIHMILIGMIWAQYEIGILKLLRNHIRTIGIGVCFISVVLVVYFDIISELLISIPYSGFLLYLTVVFFVCFLVLIIVQKFKIGNSITRFLGKHSLEIYMVHGLVMMMTRGIENDSLWCLIVLLLSIVFSVPLNLLFSSIQRIIVKLIESLDKN